MKPEHEELIEAIAQAHWDEDAMWGVKWERLKPKERGEISARMKRALRAAAERGYVLAKLPEAKEESGYAASMGRMEFYIEGAAEGWNECLDEIETVRVDE